MRYIGQEIRKNVHKMGLFHRSVHILVENAKEEILLQKRLPSKVLQIRAE